MPGQERGSQRFPVQDESGGIGTAGVSVECLHVHEYEEEEEHAGAASDQQGGPQSLAPTKSHPQEFAASLGLQQQPPRGGLGRRHFATNPNEKVSPSNGAYTINENSGESLNYLSTF